MLVLSLRLTKAAGGSAKEASNCTWAGDLPGMSVDGWGVGSIVGRGILLLDGGLISDPGESYIRNFTDVDETGGAVDSISERTKTVQNVLPAE